MSRWKIGDAKLGNLAYIQGSPAAAADDAVLALTAQAVGAVVVGAGFTQPDMPRVLQVVGDTAGIDGDTVIEGTNINGDAISEAITMNGVTPVVGTKAFRTVTKVTLPAWNASGDMISVGFVDKLGLGSEFTFDPTILTVFNGVVEGTAPTATVDADEVEKNVIDLNSALDGSEIFYFYVVP